MWLHSYVSFSRLFAIWFQCCPTVLNFSYWKYGLFSKPLFKLVFVLGFIYHVLNCHLWLRFLLTSSKKIFFSFSAIISYLLILWGCAINNSLITKWWLKKWLYVKLAIPIKFTIFDMMEQCSKKLMCNMSWGNGQNWGAWTQLEAKLYNHKE